MDTESGASFGLSWAQDRVREFHRQAGHPVAGQPTEIDPSRLRNRIEWMREEISELENAHTIVDQTDAIIDLLYFALGTLVEMGVPGEAAFDVVHRANMRKITSEGVASRHDGKIQKPQSWLSPEAELADVIVSEASRYHLVTGEIADSAAACLAMISTAVGRPEWDLSRFAEAIPRSFTPAHNSARDHTTLRAGSLEQYLTGAACPLSDSFVPINVVDEASFHGVLEESLATYPGLIVGFQTGQAYRSVSTDERYALIFGLSGDSVHIVDPAVDNAGARTVNVDDLFAGIRGAMDGVHRIQPRS